MTTPALPLHVVLLGASGFIGSAVLRRLAALPESSCSVNLLVHRQQARSVPANAETYQGAVTALPSGLIPQVPHVIIHCASKQIDRDNSGYGDNLQGIKHIAASINEYTRAVLFTSSYAVYGEGPQSGLTEEAVARPQSELAHSRLECEAALAELAFAGQCHVAILRTRFVLGAGDDYVLPGIVRMTRKRLSVGSGRQRFSIIGVDDLAAILVKLGRQLQQDTSAPKKIDIFNVGYSRPVSLREIQTVLAEFTRAPEPSLRIPVREFLLRPLGCMPSARLRQLVHRIRLIGYDHFGDVGKLAARLGDNILQADPLAVVRAAASSINLETLS